MTTSTKHVGPFAKALIVATPAAVVTAAAVIARNWHYEGASHSIGDAILMGAMTCGAAAFSVGLAKGKHGSAIAATAVAGVAGALGDIGVIGYTTAPALAWIGWAAAMILTYVLTWTGWTRRRDAAEGHGRQVELAAMHYAHHEKVEEIRAGRDVEVARITRDEHVQVAQILGSAYADLAQIQQRHPAPHIAPYRVPEPSVGLELDEALRKMLDEPVTMPDRPAAEQQAAER